MSLKENITSIKEEISTQEQFFENFFKVEKFYKKYKMVIFGVVIAIFLAIVFFSVKNYIDSENLIKSNDAYNKVMAKNDDKTSLDELKNANEKLYNIALFQISKDKTSAPDIEYLSDIALYNDAVKKGDIAALDGMILKQDFLLKDFAIVSKTLILIEKEDYKKAKETILKINPKSRVVPISDMLQHFLLTK
jgi:hypothetical protein